MSFKLASNGLIIWTIFGFEANLHRSVCSSSLQVVCSLTILSTSRAPSLLLSSIWVRRIFSPTSKGRTLLGHTFHSLPVYTNTHLPACVGDRLQAGATFLPRLMDSLTVSLGLGHRNSHLLTESHWTFLLSLPSTWFFFSSSEESDFTQSNTWIFQGTFSWDCARNELNVGPFL